MSPDTPKRTRKVCATAGLRQRVLQIQPAPHLAEFEPPMADTPGTTRKAPRCVGSNPIPGPAREDIAGMLHQPCSDEGSNRLSSLQPRIPTSVSARSPQKVPAVPRWQTKHSSHNSLFIRVGLV